MDKSSLPARLAPPIFVLLWSTGFIGAKMGSPYSEPMTFLSLRFAIVAVILMIVIRVTKAPVLSLDEKLKSMFAGALIHGGYLGAVFWAIDNGMPAGVSALVVALQPMMTAVAAAWLAGMSPGRNLWIGIAVGLAGVGLVLAPKINLADEGITYATSGACALGALSISLGTVFQKRFLPNVDLRTGTFYQYAGALFVVALVMFATERGEIAWSGPFVFALAWLVLVLSIGAIWLLMLLIRHGDVSRTASLFYLVPAATVVEGWLLFGETLSTMQIAGMVITVVGVAIAMRVQA